MKQKTILITGADSGLGKDIALYFAGLNYNVSATMLNPNSSSDFSGYKNVITPKMNVRDDDSIKRAIDDTIEKFGTIDILVNNAGFGLIGPLETATSAQIYKQFDVNVFGYIRTIQAILPHFRDKKSGIIVNISSLAQTVGLPFASLYHSTKWAIGGLSESLRYELEPFNIKIKLIMPPGLNTEFYTKNMEYTNSEMNTVYDEQMKKSIYVDTSLIKFYPIRDTTLAVYDAVTDDSNKFSYAIGQTKTILMLRRVLPENMTYGILKNKSMADTPPQEDD